MDAIIIADVIGTVLRRMTPAIPYSRAAHRLLLGTAAHESGLFRFIDQKTNGPEDLPGPAYGYFQMEKPTHDDLFVWAQKRPHLWQILQPWLGQPASMNVQRLYNPFYAAAMARLLYWRSPVAMPADDDTPSLAALYKRVWNTPAGKATEAQFIDALARAESVAQDARARA